MDKKAILKLPLRGFSGLRTLHYFMQFQTMSRLTAALPFAKNSQQKTNQPQITKIDFETLYKEMRKLTDRDIDNISEGVYPVQVLKTESLIEHTLRLPKLFVDGLKIRQRREQKQSKVFAPEAVSDSTDLPEYYRRNFHFQTDGYLSEDSAELYEHQVELLFSGMGDAMRRLFIKDLKTEVNKSPALNRGLHALEIGCGTGRTTRFVRLAFPQAKITASDLSSPYLKVAQKKLADLKNIGFLQADATNLPFKDAMFDVIYNVFLFHELPRIERENVLHEAFRALKPGGFIAIVDSLQLGDLPDFDKHLERFPVDFHEPFYTDYIKNPLDAVLDSTGFSVLNEGHGFLAKYLVAQKPL